MVIHTSNHPLRILSKIQRISERKNKNRLPIGERFIFVRLASLV
jgi:hypothetical protein